MTHYLKANPRLLLQISDDSEAKALLTQIGALHKFHSSIELQISNTQMLMFNEHETHWIIATKCAGPKGVGDDGYYAVCLPKVKITSEKAVDVFTKFQTGQSKVVVTELFKNYWTDNAQN